MRLSTSITSAESLLGIEGDKGHKYQGKGVIHEKADATDEKTGLDAEKETVKMLRLEYRYLGTSDVDAAKARKELSTEFL